MSRWKVVILCLLSFMFEIGHASFQCNPKTYDGAFLNIVCVCNATFCDEIEPIGEIAEGKAIVYRSSLDGDRLKRMSMKMKEKLRKNESVNVTITIDASERFQNIFGFGGAFTDSAGDQFVSLSETLQNYIVDSYFGKNGLEYNIGRVPIASCDFSTHEYSYDDVHDDFELKHFALPDEDLKLKIPFIKKAIEKTEGNIQLFASPWSAPGWMKVTGRMRGGGAMRNDKRVYQAYADYFFKFFEAYSSHAITFWGLTIQNEPSTGADMAWRWQTMNYTAETMRDFLKKYLGPKLKENKLTETLKVMVLDDGRGLLPGWADTIFNDPEATKYADGVAVHWYGNLYSPAVLLDITQRHHPTKFIFGTEACAGYFGHHGPIMGDWFRAESYADDIITDLNHHVTGWTDWNLCLDETGGPNWAYNVVDSPIIVNRTAQEFYKQPMFYALGHFSKFLPRGSTRVFTKIEGNLAVSATSVVIEGGRRATVILSKASNSLLTRIVDSSTGFSIVLNLPPRSIHTVIWKKRK
ncbi:Putative glucosylceramidase 3 [Caenorhabditis elegans]|uniref:Putative glucosylceramidase 3 n=1 Tax=Caenorhabditis elegans TaxID=6239 RepID=GLCM3_CAEEL|nr:Putative glucosylceramidase 3 [Caenorhabditis elegans]G5ECR8.1 RecName: Full=Putative glucosylceramidase 3; Flags: Precursor [Caenorhabditis elegans]CAB02924.1 Putative glucosylceramidase 3 [Caenorhabditis elegans]|eukprot:NP_503119.1 Putative glucosylceramidase 3 [Caenorhabditis elegans]